MSDNRVLRIVPAKLLIPYILLFGLYVQFHGDFGPGGGFQAGVIFAAGCILYGLVFGLAALRRAVSPVVLEVLGAVGVLVFAGTGVATMARGRNFLDYDAFGAHGQHWGILVVEFGVGLAVTAVMLSMFFAFAGRGKGGASG
mgnify:FL=1